ncbi:iron-sulfur cluster assembly scaffold protein [Polycladidibacter stylochi]|uniref:iron-sulfur cluster assembly scaffold protein n=1 Tax=Polycladidibacter stylochi TaxID=1807766 RepID=UPI0008321DF8|nr:iron-sulfur cluster assembly scaffold protein [Pseudovibrio stylochi]
MLNDVYNNKILEFAGNIALLGELPDPHASAKAHSRLCGSTVRVTLCAENGVVTEFAQDVKACALGQASASILAKHIIGSRFEEVVCARDQLAAMLKEGGAAPTGRFEDLKYLEPVKDYRARHASTLLAFNAVVDAIEQLSAQCEAH